MRKSTQIKNLRLTAENIARDIRVAYKQGFDSAELGQAYNGIVAVLDTLNGICHVSEEKLKRIQLLIIRANAVLSRF